MRRLRHRATKATGPGWGIEQRNRRAGPANVPPAPAKMEADGEAMTLTRITRKTFAAAALSAAVLFAAAAVPAAAQDAETPATADAPATAETPATAPPLPESRPGDAPPAAAEAGAQADAAIVIRGLDAEGKLRLMVNSS